jgi:hypothetical protein
VVYLRSQHKRLVALQPSWLGSRLTLTERFHLSYLAEEKQEKRRRRRDGSHFVA